MSDQVITANLVLGILGGHVGEKNGITARDLALMLIDRYVPGNTAGVERRVRKLVQELRNEGMHICGTPETGYFMAATAAELDRTCMFLYARAMTSLEQISKMKKVSLPDLRGQLKLPT